MLRSSPLLCIGSSDSEPSIKDVMQILHTFGPPPLLVTVPITLVTFWTTSPLPILVGDVIYGWSLLFSPSHLFLPFSPLKHRN